MQHLCMFRKCCVCIHVYRHAQCKVPACRSDFFVYCKQITPAHTNIRAEGRVWQLRVVLFIDVLPQREVDGGGVMEGAGGKMRMERIEGQRRAVS